MVMIMTSSFLVAMKLSLVSRYASLYFCCAIEQEDNELLTLEIIHRYVELLDKYFGSVSFFAQGSFYYFYGWVIYILKIFCKKITLILIDEFNPWSLLKIIDKEKKMILTGVRTRHHLQLWEGVLHVRWTDGGRWSLWDQ